MPATPTHQDPLQTSWRLEELTPDVRRRLFDSAPRRLGLQRVRREGPARLQPTRHTERPLSR